MNTDQSASGFWASLCDSSLDGLGSQGMHLSTDAFLFVVSCKTACHRWLEKVDTRLATRLFRVSISLSLFVFSLVLVMALGSANSIQKAQIGLVATGLVMIVGCGLIA